MNAEIGLSCCYIDLHGIRRFCKSKCLMGLIIFQTLSDQILNQQYHIEIHEIEYHFENKGMTLEFFECKEI